MTPDNDDALWRNRFIAVNMMRLGLVIWQSDVIVPGGSILGFPITIVALIVSFWGPKWLSRHWQKPPRP
jgi:hypothetical protein